MLGQAQTIKPSEEQVILPKPTTGKVSIPGYIEKIIWLGLSIIACALPFCFGGVHETTYSIAYLLAFTLTLLLAYKLPNSRDACFKSGSISKQVLLILSILIGYCCLQYVIFSFTTIEHPVLGTYSKMASSQKFFNTLVSLVFFSAMYYLSRNYLAFSERNKTRLWIFLIGLGFVVSLVALAHWFYDNGKLFWYYAPENILITPRARWPFVNPNHMASFLLPIVFLTIGYISNLGLELGSVFRSLQQRSGEKYLFETLLTSRRARKHTFMIIVMTLIVLSTCLATAGSLSRSAWLGGSVGLTIFLILDQLILRIKEPDIAKDTGPKATDSNLDQDEIFQALNARRRKNKRLGESDRAARLFANVFSRIGLFYKPLIFVVASFIFYLFLMGRGLELLEERVDYGLTSTKDDIRWQLYKDTVPMISEYPLMGVGLGQWSVHYPKYMDNSLSGVNPIYLHSEPLSMLVELGALGVLPLIVLAFLLISSCIRNLVRLDMPTRYFLLAMACGMISVLIASFLEFPFRIPAICCIFAYLLALVTSILDSAQSKISLEPKQTNAES